MKKKILIVLAFVCVSIISIVRRTMSAYFFATKPLPAGGIFNMCKDSVLEIKAETEEVGVSYGTGQIIKTDGTIVTNAHVINYKTLGEVYVFDNIYVRFIDERDYRKAEVVKYDVDLDIAVLKVVVTDRSLKAIKVGDDSSLMVGDEVYAIGNMSNYGLSLTVGTISIPHVNVSYDGKVKNVIQCDLTISDGNSGGALIDSKGRLIGITTFRLKDKTNSIIYGISYCIPINTVMKYIEN